MMIGLMFLVGLMFGSFLNVCILRLAEKKSVSGRSQCPACHQQLTWWQLVPLGSWLFLKGRCYFCKVKISWQYPLVELLLGLSWAWSAWWLSLSWFSFSVEFVLLAVMSFVWLFLFVYDLKYYLVPDIVIGPTVVGLSLWLGWSFLTEQISSSVFVGHLLAVGLTLIWFGGQYLLSKGRWLGSGDIGIGVVMGLWLGWPRILVALFIAYVGGAIISLGLVSLGWKKWQSAVPFGVFLSLASWLTWFWGAGIWNWYFSF